MSVILGGENVGDPISLMIALGEVAEKVDTRPYAALLSAVLNDGSDSLEYKTVVRSQARKVLRDAGPRLSRDTRMALIRLSG